MRVGFMGTPGFVWVVAEALRGAGHELVVVYARGGGGIREVGERAREEGLEVRTPREVSEEEAGYLRGYGLDVMVVAAYGLMLSRVFLGVPRLGCWNVHFSLAPKWRGAAPVERALMAGEEELGVSILEMREGLDDGRVAATRTWDARGACAGEAKEALALLGGELMVETLERLEGGCLELKEQEGEVSWARRVGVQERRLDWRRGAKELEGVVRGLSPRPGAWFEGLGGERVRVLEARAQGSDERGSSSGEVLEAGERGLLVGCGGGALRITRLQRAGRKAMGAGEFLRGYGLKEGGVLALKSDASLRIVVGI